MRVIIEIIGTGMFALATLVGCATSHKLAEPDLSPIGLLCPPDQAGRLRRAARDGRIASLLDSDGLQAKLPGSIALARLDASYGGCCGGWRSQQAIDTAEIRAWDKTIEGTASFTGFKSMPHLLLTDRGDRPVGIESLRLAAARMKCELLLVYVVASSQVDNFNNAAALYWTFVGLWLVPGNVIEHKTVMQAILVDCRSGEILGTCTGGSYFKGACPMAFAQIKRDKFRQQARPAALNKLQENCRGLLAEVARRVCNTPEAQPKGS